MARAATDVMQSIIFSAVLDAIESLKAASGGLPNQMVRDIQSIHRNTTFDDLPKELQAAIGASVRTAFTQLLKEGYAVGPSSGAPSRPPLRRPDERPRGPRPPRGPAPGGPRSPRGQRSGANRGPSGSKAPGGGKGPGGRTDPK